MVKRTLRPHAASITQTCCKCTVTPAQLRFTRKLFWYLTSVRVRVRTSLRTVPLLVPQQQHPRPLSTWSAFISVSRARVLARRAAPWAARGGSWRTGSHRAHSGRSCQAAGWRRPGSLARSLAFIPGALPWTLPGTAQTSLRCSRLNFGLAAAAERVWLHVGGRHRPPQWRDVP